MYKEEWKKVGKKALKVAGITLGLYLAGKGIFYTGSIYGVYRTVDFCKEGLGVDIIAMCKEKRMFE